MPTCMKKLPLVYDRNTLVIVKRKSNFKKAGNKQKQYEMICKYKIKTTLFFRGEI